MCAALHSLSVTKRLTWLSQFHSASREADSVAEQAHEDLAKHQCAHKSLSNHKLGADNLFVVKAANDKFILMLNLGVD